MVRNKTTCEKAYLETFVRTIKTREAWEKNLEQLELISFVTPVAVLYTCFSLLHILISPTSCYLKEKNYFMHTVFGFCKASAFKKKDAFLKKICIQIFRSVKVVELL